jgi:hypothetical protein
VKINQIPQKSVSLHMSEKLIFRMGKGTKNISRLPQELKIYFWDMEFDELSVEKTLPDNY